MASYILPIAPTFVWKQTVRSLLPIEFGELPYLIASAMHADEDSRALAAVGIKADLAARVDSGTLRVRNPVDLGWRTIPVGEQLWQAVLLPDEVVPLFAERGIDLRITPGEEPPGQSDGEIAFSSLEGVAKEAARREYPAFGADCEPTGDPKRSREQAERHSVRFGCGESIWLEKRAERDALREAV